MKFFTSDTHYQHANIIKYANRPYKDVEEMNEALIENWNKVVTKTDEVYHLGDWGYFNGTTFRAILKRLNGKKHLIRGNHDNFLRQATWEDLKDVEWIKDYFEIRVHNLPHIVLSHYPLYEWHQCHRGSYMLHGHCHGNINDKNVGLRRMDVGVDSRNYTPISLDEVIELMEKEPHFPHHKKVAEAKK